ISVAVLCRVLPERAQQIQRVARRQTPVVKKCAKAQPFGVITTFAEQAGFQTIEPRNFLRAGKIRMIVNIVPNADEFAASEEDRPVPPLDKPGCDRKILIARVYTGSKFTALGHCRLVASA